MLLSDVAPSRLYHAIVLVGCAMAPACVDPSTTPTQHGQCTAPDPDAGIVGDDGCVPFPADAATDGWPPTK